MLRSHFRIFLVLVALAPLCQFGILGESTANAAQPLRSHYAEQREARTVYSNHMFNNYYVGPSCCAGGAAAQLYVSPLPTPPMVGHTYITYQPLLPHEMMYRHNRTYFRNNGREGWSHTRVRYR